jgi:hypothetical protein
MTYRCTACQTDEHPREAHSDYLEAVYAMVDCFVRGDRAGSLAWLEVAKVLQAKGAA